jgi:hypothetical protein
LEEIDGAVSVRSFELLTQWLYLGRVNFGELEAEEKVTAIIEFVRIADMCGVAGMESMMAKSIKSVIMANPAPPAEGRRVSRYPDTNAYCLTPRHIISAAYLPDGHPVRDILATAAVEGFLLCDDHKFLRESREVPNFSADLLKAVKATLKTLRGSGVYGDTTFEEPISGIKVVLTRGSDAK